MISREIRGLDFDSYFQHIRCFTDEELIPREIEMVDAGEVPADLVERMAQVGLFGITLPREWGGLGWSGTAGPADVGVHPRLVRVPLALLHHHRPVLTSAT